MPAYKCKIALADGTLVERMVQAGSVSSLKKQVAKGGEFLVKAEKAADGSSSFSFLGRQKLKPKDFYSFNQEFLTLLRAGLPVVIALDGIIEKQEMPFFSQVLKSIRDDIFEGEAISSAFEKYKNLFSPLYVATLKSGEASGNIPDAIEEYLVYFERTLQIRQKIKSAAVYPVILIACSSFVVLFLLVFVVPVITETFTSSGSQLPLFTRILLGFSEMIRSYFWVGMLCLFSMVTGLSFYGKTEKGKWFFDRLYLKLPFFGQLSVIYATSLFSASLSTVLAGGLPLNQALGISKGLIKNFVMREGIEKAISSIEQGAGFAQAFREINLFPGMAIRMMAAGEEGGNLEKVLKDIARFYEKDTEAKLSMMTSAIEPALMVLMGFIIGFIILALYMPIFQMAGALG